MSTIKSSFQLVTRSFSIARPYWKPLSAILILHLLATPIALLKPIALKILIDSGFSGLPVPAIIQNLFPEGHSFTFQQIVLLSTLIFMLVALVENLYAVAIWVLSIYTGEKIVLRFRTILFNHVQRLSLVYHDQHGGADSLYRIQYDTMAIRTLLIGNFSPIIAALVTVTGMLIVMFTLDAVLAIIALSLVPILFLLTRTSATRLQNRWRMVKEDESATMNVAHEVLNTIRVVKAFGQEEGENRRFSTKADKAVKGQLKVGWLGARYYFIVEMLFASGTAAFIYFGGFNVRSGDLTIGELTMILAYLAQIYGPMVRISKNINDLQSSLASVERAFSLLDKETEVHETHHPKSFHRARGSVTFSDVSFTYPDGRKALEDISFEVEAGDCVGIIGSTGSGKTTLMNLLMRFYDCTTGRILLDGSDIRDLKLTDYRNQFALVLQDPLLFSTSIEENIRFGCVSAKKEEVIRAAKLANIHDFIINTRHGYETRVGDRGMQLSGGERQRIALARAFIKNAPVLILDEPTSSIDLKTESQIIEAMERLMEGRTTFLITHRLEGLRSSNMLVHLERGRLVEVIKPIDGGILEKKKSSFLHQGVGR